MTEDRLPLTSQNMLDDKIAALRELFPEVFAEGKVDFERLKQALGESIEEGRERYGLSWAGKSEAIRNLQAQSVGTLTPVPEESVNFETTENIFIEGDNLEVLKLLQKSYHNQIKMIYIDPPYNTGKEFIYPDNFREGLEDYLRYSGQKNGEGIKLTTNTETNGRFHSKWLNMMYPRLFLARNLLKEDGVIFVSIDDHEVHNLRALMNEIFGEENFIASVIWQKVFSPKNSARHFSEDHDYIIVYVRNSEVWLPNLLARTEEANARYSNPDNDPRDVWSSGDLTARNFYADGQYEVRSPSGKTFVPPRGRYWAIRYEKFLELEQDKRIWWGEDGDSMPRLKRFLSEVKQGIVPQTLWKYSDVGHTQEAKKELVEFVQFENTDNVLDTVKPTRLIQRILQLATTPLANDLVLDFFSGSASTAHAVLKQNKEDGGNRRFICVQLPEYLPIAETKLKTIADIGKARIHSAIANLDETRNGDLDLNGVGQHDRGFKVFTLTESNFKIWDGTAPQNVEQLSILLQEFAENIRPGTTKLGMLYEILLKAGFPLTAKVEKLEIAGQEIYAIEDQELFICLEYEILEETVRQILTYQPKPKQFISLDSSFRGNDQLKTNTQLQMRDHDIKFRTV
ncbi:site-specific DNA-methyltransferase [Candidatus Synechococcus calcipolaris G9]|uniref:Site-specific DNA-methyltransferase n=1 Tax=Candidatus Synechococcus calcipolaris G9 TaxID=1497997 RepID=A0ABT6F1M7_9SYNE|nr:site-specific DNA-methyltransferase [Candidatus Synechococcus calcipolaris]MDG2991765.1 site-specific DNA-methyltransferase [Candidatus Synechococcus calcipolaris G9]